MAEASGPTATFRAFTLQGRKARGEWQGAQISVGTRSTCALSINDPVVADEHCRLGFTGAGFVVEDLGSVTATWLNGVAVKGKMPLASGDQLVIGVTRLTVEVKQEEGRPILELTLEEAGFHYKRPKPGEFHTDADEWVRSEVRFGRIPAVRQTAWILGLSALGAFLWLFTTGTGERALQPGRLDGSHGALFASDAHDSTAPLSERASFREAIDQVRHRSCSVCHAGSEPGDVASCGGCHAEMAQRHPFLAGGPELEADLSAAVARPQDGCRLCHAVDHSGLTAEQSIAAAKARSAVGAPGGDICVVCHSEGLPSPDETLRRVVELARKRMSAAPEAKRDVHVYGFDDFSHASHLAAKLDCGICHSASGPGGTSGDAAAGAPATLALSAHQDFARPGFQVCAACHVDGLDVPSSLPGLDAAALANWRSKLAQKSMLVKLSWHGRGEGCTACHGSPAGGAAGQGEAPDGALLQVQRKLETASFGITPLGHGKHMPPVGSKADCRLCHGDVTALDRRAGQAGKRTAFLHGAHVAQLQPKTTEQMAAESVQVCATCHSDQWASTSLSQAAAVKFPDACLDCHTDPGSPDRAKALTRVVETTQQRSTTEFSHAAHRDQLAEGCFACHAFQGQDDGDPRAVPVLLEGVADCTKCHGEHRNIAAGACSFCHPARPQGEAGTANLFRGERPSRQDWPAGFQFAHFTGAKDRGHASYVLPDGIHAEKGCGECHSLENLAQAKRVRDVSVPDSRGWLCVDCHANNRGWFHWSLPDPKEAPARLR